MSQEEISTKEASMKFKAYLLTGRNRNKAIVFSNGILNETPQLEDSHQTVLNLKSLQLSRRR